jgi:hypothetical protein
MYYMYSILFYSILFYSIQFYSILFYSVLFYSILFYSILFYFRMISYSIQETRKDMRKDFQVKATVIIARPEIFALKVSRILLGFLYSKLVKLWSVLARSFFICLRRDK